MSEGVEISFKKLQFRNVYGIKISDVMYKTRSQYMKEEREANDFRDILKAMLEDIERMANNVANPGVPELPVSTRESMFDVYQ